jgi:hypothetical protein
MGRPPLGKRAMSNAERQARKREREAERYERIDAVLAADETRSDFIREAIERELKRRERRLERD